MQRTLNQIEAARRNGAKSHGPVTPEGKARVSQNGIKHGIYAQTVVLENEDESLYKCWRDAHLAEWAPATETEQNLVLDIVDARWRLRRLSVIETKALDFEIGRMRPEIDEAFLRIDEGTRTVFGLTSLITLNRTWEVIQTAIRAQHRIIDRATAQLLKLGRVRRPLDGPDHDDEPRDDDHQNPQPTAPAGPDADASADDASRALPANPAEPAAATPAADSEDQTREEAAAPQTAATAAAAPPAQNPESKPEPVRIHTPVRPRAVFDPTLDTPGRAPGQRLRAA